MSGFENDDVMPEFWIDGFAASGVPRWAALRAWNEAVDEDTVLDIKRRAKQIADEAAK